jgi:hypothetical protein
MKKNNPNEMSYFFEKCSILFLETKPPHLPLLIERVRKG